MNFKITKFNIKLQKGAKGSWGEKANKDLRFTKGESSSIYIPVGLSFPFDLTTNDYYLFIWFICSKWEM